jgi:hypothetical protein
MLEPPASQSSLSIEGIGFDRSRKPGSVLPGLWIVAGRRVEDGARISVLGAGSSFARGSWSAGVGALDGAPAGAIAVDLRSTGTAAALEIALARGGVAALLSAESVAGPLRIRGRWRHRADAARRVGPQRVGVAPRPRADSHASGALVRRRNGRVELEAGRS